MTEMHTDLPKTINEATPKRLRHSEIFGRITVCLDRETGQTGTCNIEKIPDQVPSTRNGHQKIIRQSSIRG